MELGRVGVWNIGLRSEDPDARGEITDAAAELEELGYGTIWLGSSPGVEHAVPLIEATSRIVVATGILNIWAYDADTVARRHADVTAKHPGRFLLGLGVSHSALVPSYRKPYAAMVEYLDSLDAAAPAVPKEERVLAALGPKMLKLAGDRALGAHPYLVTPEFTSHAREVLGRGPLLAPEAKVVMETEPGRARALAREHLSIYLQMENYTRNLLRLGFTEDDLRDGGSDHLIDACFAWGDLDTIRKRIVAFHEAGADHVAVQVIADGERRNLPRREWRDLAGALGL
ncbi:LLM class F420-dependent oxidoreductase [Actinomadura scrupuli]|uniref:LLM class F420-dependent oxidoreductase n=1 Tax=Actinomadura scrupuli TaxID=559629 RepID=UPI003D995DAC